MYHAIDRLAKAGLVEAGEPTREGRRPERTVYAITESGREELEAWLTDLLAVPDHDDPVAYTAALSLIAYLPPETATAALRAAAHSPRHRAGRQPRTHGGDAADPATAVPGRGGVPAGDDRVRARVHRRLVDELERGKLSWDIAELRRLAESGSDADWEALRLATGEPPADGRFAAPPRAWTYRLWWVGVWWWGCGCEPSPRA